METLVFVLNARCHDLSLSQRKGKEAALADAKAQTHVDAAADILTKKPCFLEQSAVSSTNCFDKEFAELFFRKGSTASLGESVSTFKRKVKASFTSAKQHGSGNDD